MLSSIEKKLAMGILILCGFAVLIGVYNALDLNTGELGTTESVDGEGSLPTLLSKGQIQKDHLMLVELTGPIMSQGESGGLFEDESVARVAVRAMKKALEDNSVKGVLLFIDSPGGTVGMSQELNEAVKRLREKKPVVASLGDLCASGGYYTAVAADKIVTNPGTLTGSIGVIISTMNLTELFNEKLGIEAVTIKSGKFKDILSPYRKARPEEIALIQHMIDESYQQFLGAVIDGRTKYVTDEAEKKKLIATIKQQADGRIILGSDAVKMGMADEIGDQVAARKLLDQMAKERFGLRGKDLLPLQKYGDSNSFLEILGLAKINVDALEAIAAPPAAQATSGMIPFSWRYPNRPLWIME